MFEQKEKSPQALQSQTGRGKNVLTQSIPQVAENIPFSLDEYPDRNIRAFRPWSNVSSFCGKAKDLRLLSKCIKLCIEAGEIS